MGHYYHHGTDEETKLREMFQIPDLSLPPLSTLGWLIGLPFFVVILQIEINFTTVTILKCQTQWNLTDLQCGTTITTIQFQNIFITPKGNPTPISCYSLSLPSPASGNH